MDSQHVRLLVQDLKELAAKLDEELSCSHKHYSCLDFFDGDGGIVIQRIKCDNCGLFNTKDFGEALEPNLWTGRDNNNYHDCRHQIYEEENYRAYKNTVICNAKCLNCHKSIIHIHPFEKIDKDDWYGLEEKQ